MSVRVQTEGFSPGDKLSAFQAQATGAGAVVTFTGIVRDNLSDPIHHMEIEHYPAMTEKALLEIEAEAVKRWSLTNSLIIHRYGLLKPDDVIMMVATAAPHRKAAFEAAEFMMDYLKSRAPFWKREITEGNSEWVSSKDDDEAALNRW